MCIRNVRSASLFAIAIGLTCWCIPVRAQNQRPGAAPGSELGRDNMSRVAASAAEIKGVLLKDAGLMVELKKWVARDATDHGQIVSESDLTDDSIFDRLETDIQFRSVATALVQRYGYLVPKVNPESELAKERELLVQERTKWLAQEEEEARAGARSKMEEKMQRASQKAASCDPTSNSDCAQQQTNPTPQGNPGQEPVNPGNPPSQTSPEQPNLPSVSPRGAPSPLERTQLMQTTEGNGDDYSQLPIGYSLDPLEPMTSQGAGQSNPSMQMGSGDEGSLLSTNRSTGTQGGMYGSPIDEMGGEGIGGNPDMSDVNPFGSSAAVSPGFTYVNPTQQPARGYRRASFAQPPEMIRKPSPYNNIPSLYDMYMQAVPRPATPQRFGSQVFENGTQDLGIIPMDLPAGPDYVVGPGDGLTINLWGGVSRRITRVVDREGRVSLPEAGPVLVSGKTLGEVQQNVQQLMRTQFHDVSADVSLSRLRTIRVYEVGDVQDPGAHDISSLSTPLNALFVAGGPTLQGSMRIVKHYRGNQLVETVDLYDLLLHGVRTDMQRLENGDTIMVPPIGPQVTVEGMVRRPAIYELRDEKNLASVLELAGGLLPTAALRHIEVQRVVAHDKRTMLSLDIADTSDPSEVTKKLESFPIADGDRIRVFPIAAYNEDAVYLEGHVIRPGRYSYRADMRVTDVISSYKDLLPEPATKYAEIIRLNAPDFRPSVESFDLATAFADPSKAPTLHPLDTVRIFSKYDFENPPVVSVWGDVRTPGTYRTSGQIHLSDAVHLAGGLEPDAQTEDAQVFRYLPDGKMKIFSVSLSDALAGDTAENIVLEPRDRLLVHKSSSAVEPASVFVEGAVARPGRYPLTTNMNIADLIRVGGGLKPSADTQLADLTHYQWNNQTQLTGEHQPIPIAAALAGDSKSNIPIHNGDVLTIREVSGWSDLGASVTLKGEVRHPGTYGVRPGERLSSVIERAGGFQPGAYPYGAILQRTSVREIEAKSQDEMILRLKSQQSNIELLPAGTPQETRAKDMALQQYEATLEQLSTNPPVGRVAIRISPEIKRWQNSSSDIAVAAGDTVTVPRRPGFVMVMGQVYNPTAVAYRPGKSAKWYLSQSGGPSPMANKKAIFVIRADGSVVGARQSLWSGESLGSVLKPGDTVVVPEKAIAGGVQWQNIFLAAQVASSIASTVFIAVRP